MRSDMHKIIIQRPRTRGLRKPVKGYRKNLQRLDPEDWPAREGMKRRSGGGSKWQADLLGPLDRFLRHRVGRPWDDVFSEICAEVRARRFWVHREHLLAHVSQFVEERVVLVAGWPCSPVGEQIGRRWPASIRWKAFYVCPASGLLRKVPDHGPSRPRLDAIRRELRRSDRGRRGEARRSGGR
jgi:hypothetical protein